MERKTKEMKHRDHCHYCKKPWPWANDDDDLIVFCNAECLENYVIVQILQAKQDMARMGLK